MCELLLTEQDGHLLGLGGKGERGKGGKGGKLKAQNQLLCDRFSFEKLYFRNER